jgi:hypothetical protein
MLKFLKSLMAIVFISLTQHVMSSPQPYTNINTLPPVPYYVIDGYVLENLITSNNAAIVIDVESSAGSVARFIAQQNLSSVTQVFSVNLWPSYDPLQKYPYQQFLSNVIQENTADFITPLRMSSAEAAQALNILADFIHLSAIDSEILYQEILNWASHLSETGIICGNTWHEGSVQSAVTAAAEDLSLVVNLNDHVWYLTRS